MVTSKSRNQEDGSMDVTVNDSEKSKLSELQQQLASLAFARPETVNEKWYIISQRWMTRLKRYLDDGAKNQMFHPGPVDNQDILRDLPDGERIVKESAATGKDFDVLPAEVWKNLVSLFSVKEGSTVESRVYKTLSGELQNEVRRTAVDCTLYPNLDSLRSIYVSQAASIGECREVLTKKFGIKNEEDVRFWIFAPDGQLTMPNAGEMEDKSFADLELTIQHVVVVEVAKDKILEPWSSKEDLAGDKYWELDEVAKQRAVVTKLKEKKGLSTDDASELPGPSNRYNLRSTVNSFDDSFHELSADEDYGTGLQGLANLGNTCFMNSSIQCLSNVPELTRYFLTGDFRKDINVKNPLGKQGQIAQVFAELIHQLWKKNPSSVVPNKFKSTLARQSSLFHGAQQDAQESLQYIVDCLHEDLNRVETKPYIPMPENIEVSDEELANMFWDIAKKRDDSVITDLFHGQIRSIVICPDCRKKSVTFDPVCYYTLPLPSKQTRKLVMTYFTYDGKITPERFFVELPRNANIGELFTKISQQMNLSEDRFLVAEDFMHAVHTILTKEKALDEISDSDDIVVYEMPLSVTKPDHTTVFLYTSSSTLESEKNFVSIPIPYSVPVGEMSVAKFYELVGLRLLSCMRAPEQAKNTISQNNSTGGASDGSRTPELKFTLSACTMLGIITDNLDEKTDTKLEFRARNVDEPYFFRINFLMDNPSDYFAQQYLKLHSTMPSTGTSFDRKKDDSISLRNCFELYISPEKLEKENMWRCPVCKEEKQARKKIDMWRMPRYMIVCLKRFRYSRFYRDKISTRVTFPIKNLDLSELVINEKERPVTYDLVGMACHSGGLGGGHYWAVCKNHKNGKWFKFNDSSVSDVDEKTLDGDSTPYILVFRRNEPTLAERSDTVKIEQDVKTENPDETEDSVKAEPMDTSSPQLSQKSNPVKSEPKEEPQESLFTNGRGGQYDDNSMEY